MQIGLPSVPKDRQLVVTTRPDNKLAVFNWLDGRLSAWVLPNEKVLASLICEATRKGRFPGVYPIVQGWIHVWVLEKEQIRRFHRLAKVYEVQDQDEVD